MLGEIDNLWQQQAKAPGAISQVAQECLAIGCVTLGITFAMRLGAAWGLLVLLGIYLWIRSARARRMQAQPERKKQEPWFDPDAARRQRVDLRTQTAPAERPAPMPRRPASSTTTQVIESPLAYESAPTVLNTGEVEILDTRDFELQRPEHPRHATTVRIDGLPHVNVPPKSRAAETQVVPVMDPNARPAASRRPHHPTKAMFRQ